MGRHPRYVEPGKMVEVTTRTIQGRFLLRPSRELQTVVLGILGRAQRKYGMVIHHFVFMSNHAHLLVSPTDAQQLADFMRFVNGNLAKEVGRLHRWRTKIWARRYKPITVSDEEAAQVGRLLYLLANGCKEGLVASPREWPGVSATRAWLTGKRLEGLWFDRTREYAARQRREEYSPLDFAEQETVTLTPLPCWAHLPPHRVRAEIAARVRQVEEETSTRHRADGTAPAGANAIRSRHPHDKPERPDHSLAPLFHVASKAAFWDLYHSLSEFLAEYATARERQQDGLPASFPQGSFPSPLAFVPP